LVEGKNPPPQRLKKKKNAFENQNHKSLIPEILWGRKGTTLIHLQEALAKGKTHAKKVVLWAFLTENGRKKRKGTPSQTPEEQRKPLAIRSLNPLRGGFQAYTKEAWRISFSIGKKIGPPTSPRPGAPIFLYGVPHNRKGI